MPPTERDARCAVHPELPSVGTCARCGDFYCQACGDGRHRGVCVRCGALLPSGLAWEDARYGRFPIRYLRSLRDVALKPRLAFPGPPKVGPALAFAMISGLLLGILGTAGGAAVIGSGNTAAGLGLEWFREGVIAKAVACAFLVIAGGIASLAFAGASAVSFGAGLASVGRSRGLLRIALRAAGYAQGVTLLAFAMPFLLSTLRVVLGEPEILSTFARVTWLIAGIAFPIGTTRLFFHAGRGMGLSRARAFAASLGPWLLSIPIAVLIFDTHLEAVLSRFG